MIDARYTGQTYRYFGWLQARMTIALLDHSLSALVILHVADSKSVILANGKPMSLNATARILNATTLKSKSTAQSRKSRASLGCRSYRLSGSATSSRRHEYCRVLGQRCSVSEQRVPVCPCESLYFL